MINDSTALKHAPGNGFDWLALSQKLTSDFSRVKEILFEAGITPAFLQSIRSEPGAGEAYGRNVLFATPEAEIMLASWRPFTECAPHDHGESTGVVWLVRGAFIETQYELKEDLYQIGEPKLVAEGSLVHVSRGMRHSMRPVTDGLSLHIYSPGIHDMKVFDRDSRSSITVVDDCGAWVPSNDKIKKRESW